MSTSDHFEKAVARTCLRHIATYLSLNPFVRGDDSAVRYGAFTREIAIEAGLSVPQTRRRLLGLCSKGAMLREDTAGGSTRWWPVGLAATQLPAAPGPIASGATAQAPPRQAFTPPPPPARQHWSDILGVARDCSTSEARAAFKFTLAAVNELDLDAEQQRKRIRDAYNARLTEDGISE